MNQKERAQFERSTLLVSVAGIASCILVIALHWRRAGEIDQSFLGFIAFFLLVGIFGLAMRKWGTRFFNWAIRRQEEEKALLESSFYYGLGAVSVGYVTIMIVSRAIVENEPWLILYVFIVAVPISIRLLLDVQEWRNKSKTYAEPLDDERLRSIAARAMVGSFYVTVAAMFILYAIANALAANNLPVTAESMLRPLLAVTLLSAYFFYRHYARQGIPARRIGAGI